MDEPNDIFEQRNPTYVRVRVERTIKFVARKVMPEPQALGGQTFEELGIDPDSELRLAHTQVIRGWAHSSDGIMGYLAQWGLLEGEVQIIHHVKVFVDGQLTHEEELVK